MLHDTLNPADWRKHIETYDSLYVEGMRGRFLIRRERLKDLPKCLNDVARAYQAAQKQSSTWESKFWIPLWDEMKTLAINHEVKAHAKADKGWWLITFTKSEGFGWGWSFSWVKKPKQPINLDFGQRFYEADKFSKKYLNRIYILGDILKGLLSQKIYRTYDRKWLEANLFCGKILKINLLGDEYWYKISHTKNGNPQWENFIWQNNKTEEINL